MSLLAEHVIASESLRLWFLTHRRSLPWRIDKTPYSVLVSEVMLQQTQVSRVIHFYERWMTRFPTLQSLAEAHLDEVYKVWEGLGYYSRARSLHAMAQTFLRDHQGNIPNNRAVLLAIKGLGPYTTHALLAFAFEQNIAAVDANVVRVIARYFAILDDISKPKTRTLIQEHADSLIPTSRGFEIAEALIELGATVCLPKNPLCSSCPLQNSCRAHHTQHTHLLPFGKKKILYEKLFRDVAIIIAGDTLLLKRVASGKIMAGLYEFPYFESQPDGFSADVAVRHIEETLQLAVTHTHSLPSIPQSFTKYRVSLYPKIFVASRKEIDNFEWHPFEILSELPFSSAHKRLLSLITSRSRSFKYL